jgi:hypothetical protein
VTTVIDHITVVAPNLAAGAAYVSKALGVAMQPGGTHPRMGTHNLLLRLGESTFLEVISPDPAAPKPARPRWFELDRLTAESRPRLATWVARTNDIRKSGSTCSTVVGNIEPMSRGSLNWLITVPSDGSLPLMGAAPALIEWNEANTPAHPASALKDFGCSLIALEVFHPEPSRVQAVLGAIKFSGPVHVRKLPVSQPYLVAHIQTPHGTRTLPTT